MYFTTVKILIIVRLWFSRSKSRQALHFCMCNLVSADKANWALSAETKFHIQKYDGLENIENPSRGLEVSLGSSTYTNLGYGYSKFLIYMCVNLGISDRLFSRMSWALIVLRSFSTSVRRGKTRTVVKNEIGQDLATYKYFSLL